MDCLNFSVNIFHLRSGSETGTFRLTGGTYDGNQHACAGGFGLAVVQLQKPCGGLWWELATCISDRGNWISHGLALVVLWLCDADDSSNDLGYSSIPRPNPAVFYRLENLRRADVWCAASFLCADLVGCSDFRRGFHEIIREIELGKAGQLLTASRM